MIPEGHLDGPDPLYTWTWHHLQDYDPSAATLTHHQLHRQLQPLACVGEYFRSLYEILITERLPEPPLLRPQWQAVWERAESANAPPPGATEVPDAVPHQSQASGKTGGFYAHSIISRMATAGLDLSTTILTSRRTRFQAIFSAMLKPSFRQTSRTYTSCGIKIPLDSTNRPNAEACVRLYRQRAFDLLDDDRFYPSAGDPPTRGYFDDVISQAPDFREWGDWTGSDQWGDPEIELENGEDIVHGMPSYPLGTGEVAPIWGIRLLSRGQSPANAE